MEFGRSPPPNLPRTHFRNPISSTSVLMLHDQAIRPITSGPAASIVRHIRASVSLHESQNDYETCTLKEEKLVQTTMDTHHMDKRVPICEESEKQDFDQYLKYFERRLLYQPGFWYPFGALYTREKPYLSLSTELAKDVNVIPGSKLMQIAEPSSPSSVRAGDVLALAKRAMMASKKATLLAEKSNILGVEFDRSHFLGLDPTGSSEEIVINKETTIRSKRLLERRSKKRKVSKKRIDVVFEVSSTATIDINKKIQKGLNTDDPLRLFLWGPETKQLLTIKEEKDLFIHIQEIMRLEEVKQRLKMQFNQEPTLAEWAQAVGMSCQVLRACVHSGKRSRDKMIYANFRLVVHLAKQYEGKGLDIQDLLQEGSRGLMKSLEKFKPTAGCRFPTYAYWWIRQSIRKAIFQHSRTIRLPENVYGLLKKISNAKRLCIQEGHLPTNKELAQRVGIKIERLESLLLKTRNPLSIQERPWTDMDLTFQEITADPEVEIPDLTVGKKMMRQHVRNLLSAVLNHRERQIIKLRFGINENKQKSLQAIGDMYGISKERVRQLESRALDKLKECLSSQGLEAYVDLLT